VDLFEYQGKLLFARYGIPVSAGAPATTVAQAVEEADALG
jgi:succinyl-CoA synthetase beta subunit